MSSAVEASVDSFFGESPEGNLEKFQKKEKKWFFSVERKSLSPSGSRTSLSDDSDSEVSSTTRSGG